MKRYISAPFHMDNGDAGGLYKFLGHQQVVQAASAAQGENGGMFQKKDDIRIDGPVDRRASRSIGCG